MCRQSRFSRGTLSSYFWLERHFTTFCPLQGHFITLFPLKVSLKGTLCHFGSLEGHQREYYIIFYQPKWLPRVQFCNVYLNIGPPVSKENAILDLKKSAFVHHKHSWRLQPLCIILKKLLLCTLLRDTGRGTHMSNCTLRTLASMLYI